MKYALLVYGDEHKLETISSRDHEALRHACRDNDDALRQRGYLLTSEGLQPSHAAATVRVENGAVAVDVGPVVKTREQIIALLTVQAHDLNEAIQLAASMPQASAGAIEVRPVMALDEIERDLSRPAFAAWDEGHHDSNKEGFDA